MAEHSSTWAELLRELDKVTVEREREKLAAMTEQERDRYLQDKWIQSMLDLPFRG